MKPMNFFQGALYLYRLYKHKNTEAFHVMHLHTSRGLEYTSWSLNTLQNKYTYSRAEFYWNYHVHHLGVL